MPLLESFKVDHTRMNAPSVRLAKVMTTPGGDRISVFDLRFVRPNTGMLPPRGMHTFEHLFAGAMRRRLAGAEVIDISPMGCRTGFYMSVIGDPGEEPVREAMLAACGDIAAAPDEAVPEANRFQCGSWEYHSLAEARDIARSVLERGVTINKNGDLALDDATLARIAAGELR